MNRYRYHDTTYVARYTPQRESVVVTGRFIMVVNTVVLMSNMTPSVTLTMALCSVDEESEKRSGTYVCALFSVYCRNFSHISSISNISNVVGIFCICSISTTIPLTFKRQQKNNRVMHFYDATTERSVRVRISFSFVQVG